MKKIVFLSLISIFAWTSLFAEVIEKEFSVGDDPYLKLSNVAGDITITRGDSDRIVVKAEKQNEDIKVEMTQSGDRVTVEVDYPKNGRNMKGVTFEVQFPASGKLNITSVSGSIRVSEIRGDMKLNSVSGNVEVGDFDGDLEANSVSGNVTLTNIDNSNVEAASISGRVRFSGTLSEGDYSFNSTSGSVTVTHDDNASYEVSGQTISGGINNDAGGEITVEKAKYGPMKSLSGTYNGSSASLELNTISGSITLETR